MGELEPRKEPDGNRRFGAFVLEGLLGAGGMGEVYRARDTRLNRDVAIKVLPARVSSHPERVARLTREAQVLASLNHPHIGAIYDVQERPSLGEGRQGALLSRE